MILAANHHRLVGRWPSSLASRLTFAMVKHEAFNPVGSSSFT